MAKTPRKKSGDSKLQDAEKARTEAQGPLGAVMSAVENRRNLLKELEDSPELARAKGDPAGAERIEKLLGMLKESIDSLENRIHLVESGGASRLETDIPSNHWPICPVCRQILKRGRHGVCDGEHVLVSVSPSNPDFWPAFYPGYILNHVCYAGVVKLPRAVVDEVKAGISRWEAMERRKFIPEGRIVGGPNVNEGVGAPMSRAPMIVV